ncbi:MAG: hypothetical protein R2789_08455 [Microthrixaceae bacterium]
MGEAGLSPAEVSKEIAEHHQHAASHDVQSPADRRITIVEALMLAVVAILAAYSGFASAKWSTEESLTLARANTARTEANRAYSWTPPEAGTSTRPPSTPGSRPISTATRKAPRSPRSASAQLAPAFEAWIETDPSSTLARLRTHLTCDEYEQPENAKGVELDRTADDLYGGSTAGRTVDDYVRTAVFLATVLFLVGISGHFRVRSARYGLIGVASVMLIWSVVLLVTTPFPPS